MRGDFRRKERGEKKYDMARTKGYSSAGKKAKGQSKLRGDELGAAGEGLKGEVSVASKTIGRRRSKKETTHW